MSKRIYIQGLQDSTPVFDFEYAVVTVCRCVAANSEEVHRNPLPLLSPAGTQHRRVGSQHSRLSSASKFSSPEVSQYFIKKAPY
jgi:hypothetical protein